MVAFGSGVAFTALLIAGAAAGGGMAAAWTIGKEANPSAQLALLGDLGDMLLFVGAAIAASAAIATASFVILRSVVLPRWLGWLGLVCSVLLLVGILYVPMVALPVWTAAASIALLRGGEPAAMTA